MFALPNTNSRIYPEEKDELKEPVVSSKYKNMIQATSQTYDGETNYAEIEEMLEKEKQHNKTESWNKLDKSNKIQKLHAFAEKYGKENGIPIKEIKNLKAFFVESLDKGKLQKTKDVMYNKDTREIAGIPALHFNSESRAFTLRNLDTKRVSTLKSLTPKRIASSEESDTAR
jgi:hypothetical protein